VAITRDGVCLRCTCLDELTAERLFRDRDVGQHLTEQGYSYQVVIADDR
jgi:hypothetical protein